MEYGLITPNSHFRVSVSWQGPFLDPVNNQGDSSGPTAVTHYLAKPRAPSTSRGIRPAHHPVYTMIVYDLQPYLFMFVEMFITNCFVVVGCIDIADFGPHWFNSKNMDV